MRQIKLFFLANIVMGFLGGSLLALAVEPGSYRLLSLSDSEKLILVSDISTKKKYLLDASASKITLNGKAAEFEALKQFSIIQVKMELRKKKKKGVDLDGSASEIRISVPEKLQPK